MRLLKFNLKVQLLAFTKTPIVTGKGDEDGTLQWSTPHLAGRTQL